MVARAHFQSIQTLLSKPITTFRKQKRGRIDGARLRRSGSSKKYFFSFSLKLNWASKVLLMLAFNLWTWLDSVISLFMGGNGLTFLLSAKEKK